MSMLDLLRSPYFPVYSATSASTNILDPSVSAIVGGSDPVLLPGEEWPRCDNCEDTILIPCIQINVSSPQTPAEFRQKVGVEAEPGHIVLLQVFLCADSDGADCFGWQLAGGDDKAYLVRVIQITPDSVDTAAVEATRAELAADRFFMSQRVISGWKPGNPEMMHEAWNNDFEADDPQYLDHAPAPGLKLLGFPVQGEHYLQTLHGCPKEVLPQEGSTKLPCHSCHCLLQLGYDSDWEDGPSWSGNVWIEQCTVHPEVLSMSMSGDW